MNNAATLELRVHGGIHDGAREPLPNQDICSIGTDAGCDFVLADDGIAPSHLRLVRDGAGGWTQQAHDAPQSQPLVQGQLLPLGPVAISVAEAGSPWPDAQAVAVMAPAPVEAAPETTVEALQVPPAEEAPTTLPATPAPGPRLPWAIRLTGTLLLCLVVLVGAALWWLSAPRQAPAAGLPGAATFDAAAQRAAIAQVLRRLHLEDSSTLAAAPAGGWAVHAVGLDDDALETLALALSRLDPKPGLHVVSGEDARGLVQEALIRLSASDDATLKVSHLGGGRIRIEGSLPNDTARAELLHQLRVELPAWLVLESAIAIPAERAQRLLAELQAQSLGDIRGQWSTSPARLEVVARVEPETVPRWEQALAQAARHHPDVPFHARLELLPPRPAARLPFGVLTVVSGPDGYVVLDDGSKLMVQGHHGGWQLMVVQANEAVFENNRAQRVSVPR